MTYRSKNSQRILRDLNKTLEKHLWRSYFSNRLQDLNEQLYLKINSTTDIFRNFVYFFHLFTLNLLANSVFNWSNWSKTASPSFLPSPPPQLKSANYPSPTFLGNPPLYINFSWTPPPPLPHPESQIFQWTSKILKFSIPNPILSFKSN